MFKRKLFPALAALALGCALLASCASTADILVNKDPGSFYGSAFAATQAAAEEKAYADLIYNVLTETSSMRPVKQASFVLTPEIKEAFAGFKLKPERAEKKSETRFDVVYSLSREQWAKAEALRLERLNKELGAAFAAVKAGASKSAAARIKEAAALLVAIERSGALNKIVGAESGGPILNDRVEDYCRGLVEGISIAAEPASGLVKAGAAIGLSVVDKGGKGLPSFPLSLTWKAEGAAKGPIAAVADAKGKASALLPDDPALADKKVILAVAADLASLQGDCPFLRKLDQGIAAEFAYRNSAVGSGLDKAVKVPGGSYAVGAVKQDKRAGSIEKPRKATVAAFYIDANLVTNAEYRTYLEAVNASELEYPDYWENADLNKPDQPVVGVSLAEAEKYAAWLSSAQGVKKRLPTEDEFEIAARGGREVVYPWGDELPSDGARATFKGSAPFTTAVGSRANGKNALGLADMAGNVWEWTTTAPAGSMSGNPEHRIVKGGSYLDGQYELRISNRVLRDPGERYPDVGFRLVSEAGNE
ncbi:MAG TPA: SUMF1/EgtB/PvdO family nonheme iron enzyme [Spirochaetia bacterium]|nr:SUMF1/EgtB/PvdO family nonheme iron enzyme [Spirochaetia bacterium]